MATAFEILLLAELQHVACGLGPAAKAGVSPQTLGWYAWRLEADGLRTDERPAAPRASKAPKTSPTLRAVELAPGM